MDIQLSGIIKNEGSAVPFSGLLEIGDMHSMGSEIRFAHPVSVSGQVANVGSVLELSGVVSGAFSTTCSRCNKEISYDFSVELKEVLMQEDVGMENADEDVVLFSGKTLSVDSIVENSIYSDLELRYLCKDDCKGLCPVCGKDNNAGDCECGKAPLDPRFAVLAELKDHLK